MKDQWGIAALRMAQIPRPTMRLPSHTTTPVRSAWPAARVPAASRMPQTITAPSMKGQAVSSQRRTLNPEPRSEEHTSELQSRFDLVCRLLLEKKNGKTHATTHK